MSRGLVALRIALRQQRTGWVACALLSGAVALGTAASFPSVVGTTAEQRLASARQFAALAKPIGVLLPIPAGVDTLGGYVQWRVFGGLPFVLAAWAVVAGVNAIRGEEERGLLEQWLAAGIPRARWLLVRAVGFAVAVATVGLLVAGAAAAGACLGGGMLPPGPLLGVCAALTALTLACFGIALVAAETASARRTGLVLAGVWLGGLHLLNSVPRSAGHVPPSRWLSPFYWYERSSPLTPGGHLNLPAIAGLAATGILLVGLAGVLSSRRDLGGSLLALRPAGTARVLEPAPNPVWRMGPLAAVYEQRLALLGWVAVAGVLALALASLIRPIVQALQTTPATRGSSRLLAAGDPTLVLLGYFLFGTLQLLVALYALTEAGRWADDDRTGRLEMRLSAPVTRSRVVLERALALLAGLTLLAVAGTAAGWLGAARTQGVRLPAGSLIAAATALLPFGLSVGAAGAVLTGWRPRVTQVGLGSLIAVSFLLLEFGIVFDWPAWLVRLSVFAWYGTPLATGIWWPGLAALVAMSAAGFAAAIANLHHHDIGQ
jgi:ABC-2 type transport system permease protein